jgi:hypothetical protein
VKVVHKTPADPRKHTRFWFLPIFLFLLDIRVFSNGACFSFLRQSVTGHYHSTGSYSFTPNYSAATENYCWSFPVEFFFFPSPTGFMTIKSKLCLFALVSSTVSEVEVTLRLMVSQPVSQSVSQCLLVSGPKVTRFYFFLNFAGQLLCSSSWGALSDERTGL